MLALSAPASALHTHELLFPQPHPPTPQTPLDKKLEEERRDYAAAVAPGPAVPPGAEPDLGMRVLLVHGDEMVADSSQGGLAKACDEYRAWIRQKWPATAAA